MTKVCVLQADNRPTLDYLLKTREVNEICCSRMGYEYVFKLVEKNMYGNIPPEANKIHVLHEFLHKDEYDIIVFLDSDAWIQNHNWLNDVISSVMKDEKKQGCYSRDPYWKGNTFINSGSFVLKVNDYTRKMYDIIRKDLNDHPRYQKPYDQFYISNYIHEHKDDFVIFVPDVLNCPIGKVLRHNWPKNAKMYADLDQLLRKKGDPSFIPNTPFVEEEYYDKEAFPNTTNGDTYYE